MQHRTVLRRDFLRRAAAWSASSLAASALGACRTAPASAEGRKRTILVLGGTGFIGPFIVDELKSRGHTIVLFNRGKTNPQLFPDLEKLRGDRATNDLQALRGRRFDAVIDDAVYIPRHVRELAAALPDPGMYLMVSTLSVYEDSARSGADESTPTAVLPEPSSEDARKYYGPLKAACEREAEAAYPSRTCVARPGLIVGPGDSTRRFSYWPARVARGGAALAPGDGDDTIQVIDVRDLAQFIAVCVERGHLGIHNTVGPAEPLTMRAFLDQCSRGCGGGAKFQFVPADFLAEHKVQPWSDMPAWIPRGKDGRSRAGVSCKKAIARGLRFRPMEETCRDTLAWLDTHNAEDRAKLIGGLSPERERDVLAAWNAKVAK